MDSLANKSPTEMAISSSDKDDNFLLGIFLVKSGSKGDSLLFRYPYMIENETTNPTTANSHSRRKKESRNPFALIVEDVDHDHCQSGPSEDSCRSGTPRSGKPTATYCIELDPVAATLAQSGSSTDVNLETVIKLPDRVVSTLFAVKNELCGRKIEIKINDVRFVGHPLQVSSKSSTSASNQAAPDKSISQQNTPTAATAPPVTAAPLASSSSSSLSSSTSSSSIPAPRSKDIVAFHVVFALRANASHEVVNSFHKCSLSIAQALNKEEDEKGYLSKEAKAMLTCHDEASSPSDDGETSPYSLILQRSQLAADLKKIFESLKTHGTVQLRLNKSTDLSLCIPQTVHRLTLKYHRSCPLIGPRELDLCFNGLQDYHALLPLTEEKSILASLTSSEDRRTFQRILLCNYPTKNLSQIANEANLPKETVIKIARQLVRQAKATIIYPVCETNVYVINPLAPTSIDCPLVREFRKTFNNANLLKFLSEFSLGTTIDQLRNPLHSSQQQLAIFHQVVWLLRNRLISQLHTYVYLLPLSSSSPCLTKMSPKSRLEMGDQANHDNQSNRNETGNGKLSPNHPGESDISKLSKSDEEESYINNDASSLSMSYERAIHLLRELGFRDYECESICKVPAAKNYEDLTLFAKLCHCFNGKYHLEHIMHAKGVSRSQLLAIIDKFRDVLFTCQHEDKTVFQLCPYLYE